MFLCWATACEAISVVLRMSPPIALRSDSRNVAPHIFVIVCVNVFEVDGEALCSLCMEPLDLMC